MRSNPLGGRGVDGLREYTGEIPMEVRSKTFLKLSRTKILTSQFTSFGDTFQRLTLPFLRDWSMTLASLDQVILHVLEAATSILLPGIHQKKGSGVQL